MGRKVDQLKKALKNLAEKDVEGRTLGEVLENFNLQHDEVVLTIKVTDKEGEELVSPNITLKTGAIQGSGDVVNAETDGTYKVKFGQYNFYVTATGYESRKGILTVDYDDAMTKAKAAIVVLKAYSGGGGGGGG